MNKTLLVTLPEHDDTTHFLSKWCSVAVERASEMGIKVLDLRHIKVTKSNVESMLLKQSPKLVLFNGHGNESSVTGHQNEPIMTLETACFLRGKVVYALSCCSAKKLGKRSVEEGAEAYIGYDDDFIFVFEPINTSRPLTDKTASLFLEPSNKLVVSLIKGITVKEACNNSKDAFRDNIQKMLSSESSREDTDLVRYLWWDLQHQTCLGHERASF